MSELNPNQLAAVELLATGTMTQQAVAEAVGVVPQTITDWKKNNNFIDAIITRSRQMLKESLPKIYKKTSKMAEEGSYQHAKIIIDHIEKLEEIRSNNPGNITFTWKQ